MKRFLIFLFLTLSFQVHGNEISQLLTECQKHFKANRLTTGHKTAFVCYKEVLKKDSNNAKALAGLKKIENRYVYWARRALARGQEKKVQQYLSCLRLVNPKSSKLLEFMPAEISKAQTEIKPIPVKITLKPLQVIPIPVKETKPIPVKITLKPLQVIPVPVKETKPIPVKITLKPLQVIPVPVKPVKETTVKITPKPLQVIPVPVKETKPILVTPKSPKKITKLDTPTAGKIFKDRLKNGSFGPEMVWIPAGKFQIGDLKGERDEQAVHEISMPLFAIGRYEITFLEYDKFVEDSSRRKPNDNGWGRNERPVIMISWKEAKAYANWLTEQTEQTYRLPTEAEWEYAAKAGLKTKYWWGNTIGSNRAVCNGCESRWDNKQTAPVGSFAPNPFALYDMIGNVWEWTCSATRYGERYSGKKPLCTTNSLLIPVIRGGSWNNQPKSLRATNRAWLSPSHRNIAVGFRLVKEWMK